MILTLLCSSLLPFLSNFLMLVLSSITFSRSTSSGDYDFFVHLIHRDSPLSPFYNHTMSRFDRIESAAIRSVSRLNHFRSLITTSSSTLSSNPDISSRLVPDHGEYMMSFSIGTPPTQVHAFADTASNLIWVQCPCKSCSHKSTTTPTIFDPSQSSSYTSLSCDSFSSCEALHEAKTCRDSSQPCSYSIRYLDGATTSGTLSHDKFAFENPDRISSVDVGYLDFGCSYQSSWHFQGSQTGSVGLNRLPLSLISQLNIKKFSYCMVFPDDEGSGSRMYFGSQAVISGGITPFEEGHDWSYYVTLEGISLGDEKIPLPDGIFKMTNSGEGGVVIDSGTMYTMLRSEAYDALAVALRETIHLPHRKGPIEWFELCFEGSFEDLDLGPDVIFHFDGAEVILMKQTTYIEVEKGLWCLAIIRSQGLLSIFGNVQQQNYFVGFDLEEEVISFAPVDCATF
ncbi:hypothetical protein UlMin_009508 [Ulmus minor]